jgi:hypothetical protein
MEQRIIVFCAVFFAAIRALSLVPSSIVTRIAFSWFGPAPREGETWARYQLRWAFYAPDWFGQIAIVFALLYGAAYFFPSIAEHQLFLVFAAFALPIGGGMALLATATFLVKAAKARYIGPSPIYGNYQRGAVA